MIYLSPNQWSNCTHFRYQTDEKLLHYIFAGAKIIINLSPEYLERSV